MSVYQPKNRKDWTAEIWSSGKKVKSKWGFSSKREALTWEKAELLTHLAEPNLILQKKFMFEDLVQKYRDEVLLTFRPNTIERYEIDLEKRIIPFFRFRKLESINPMLISQFRSEILKSNLKPKSINMCMMTLQSMLSYGVDWELLKDNPCKLKPLKIAKKVYKWWDDKEDIKKFLDIAKVHAPIYYPAFRVALELGLRLGEILGLSKRDINFERCQMRVHRQWVVKQKCYGPTKHGLIRYLQWDENSDLTDILKAAVEKNPHSEILFTSDEGNRLSATSLSYDYYLKLIELSGVQRIKFHDLRHTYASWFMIEEGDIWSLMGNLGHSNIETTQIYAHLSSKHQRQVRMPWSEDRKKEEFLTCKSPAKFTLKLVRS